ncbi:MAG: 1,4-alpha-glucan branching protein GlgB, partial [Panacagrimonas sp.]
MKPSTQKAAVTVPDFDLDLIARGRHWNLWRWLGSHPEATGARFAVWAPHADRVSVIGDFNGWDAEANQLGGSDAGVWSGRVANAACGQAYKYAIRNRASGQTVEKSDPCASGHELRPKTASVITAPSAYTWQDADWMNQRAKADWLHAPMSIYELHAGSWRRGPGNRWLNWRELAAELIPYVRDLGFTHLELMPITEHPFDGSWGYQTLGYFAPTSRFGSADDLRYFIDQCHLAGLGIIHDWTAAHFPNDDYGLARFDGEPLYEHPDPRRGWHPDWNSCVFDYGRPQVRNFLIANALYWLDEFHFDALRVDAVASMLYLDYSRAPGQWVPNKYGGRENLEALRFLQELNHVVHERVPGTRVIAEESTSWPQVTRPTWVGGLGFSMKWNMGWMHDSLDYFALDPVFRSHRHDKLTFGQMYAYSENFVLPLSHDEVVHGKGSLIGKMNGDEWQKRANLRLLLAWQWMSAGKKLLFMGQEFGQVREWNHDAELDWHLLGDPRHSGLQRLVGDLNRLMRGTPALHRHDFEQKGFEWIDCHDHAQSVISFLRRFEEGTAVVILNCTPVPRTAYRIGLPHGGVWREALNTDAAIYGGSNLGNLG